MGQGDGCKKSPISKIPWRLGARCLETSTKVKSALGASIFPSSKVTTPPGGREKERCVELPGESDMEKIRGTVTYDLRGTPSPGLLTWLSQHSDDKTIEIRNKNNHSTQQRMLRGGG